MWNGPGNTLEMPRKTAPQALLPKVIDEEPDLTVYLAEWMVALGLRQGKVATAAGLSEGYIAQLMNREGYPGKNPTARMVKRIGESMEMPWHLLYEMPPSDSAAIPLTELWKYPPDLITRLAFAARERAAKAAKAAKRAG